MASGAPTVTGWRRTAIGRGSPPSGGRPRRGGGHHRGSTASSNLVQVGGNTHSGIHLGRKPTYAPFPPTAGFLGPLYDCAASCHFLVDPALVRRWRICYH